MSTLSGSSSYTAYMVVYGEKIPRGSKWVLSYRNVQYVWNTLFIHEEDVEQIQLAHELGITMTLGGRSIESAAVSLYPANWISAVIEPPFGSTATGWRFGDLSTYIWHNLGPVVEDAKRLGL